MDVRPALCILGYMRPAVDVVVPFMGSESELLKLCHHLNCLDLAGEDTISVVDNRPVADAVLRHAGRVRILPAPERQTSYYARNRGAATGHAPWSLFVDADVLVPPDLVDRYFDEPPTERVGVLAGDIKNEALVNDGRQSAAERYAHLAELFAQRRTFASGDFGYAMTANCVIRREAFEAVGGFVDHIVSGGDADICFRIRRAGWQLEARYEAAVTHLSRPTVRTLLRQSARHGSGAAWLHAAYPGFSKPGRVVGVVGRSTIAFVGAGIAAARGDRDRAVVSSIDAARSIAFEIGRRRSNEVPARPAPG